MHPREHFDSIDSTNEYLKRISMDAPDGLVVSAGEQTQGKGRLQRSWLSRRGQGAWFSLFLRDRRLNGENAAGLVFVCALAAAQSLSVLTKSSYIRIKWPNDLVMSGKKIAGILCESSFEANSLSYIICGIGINLNAREFPPELPWAASVCSETGVALDSEKVISAFLESFDKLFEVLLNEGLQPVLAQIRPLSATLGQMVSVLGREGEIRGKAVDFAQDGALIVDDGSRQHTVNVGDVSVRGVMGYI